MRLYKFVGSQSAVLNMARGVLKFTPIGELNDPTELTPVMDHLEVLSSLELLRSNGLTEDQFVWLCRQGAILELLAPEEQALGAPRNIEQANELLKYDIYENLDYMEKKLFATIKLIRSRVGVFSVTERFDSLPMWAHYANLAKGYVVVFDGLEESFNGDETGSLNIPKRVVYTERFEGMTFDPSTQDRLFFSKLVDWSYEREWRVVTSLISCRRLANSSLYLRDVDPARVVGVIAGWNVPANEVLSLREELDRLNHHVELASAFLDGSSVFLRNSLTSRVTRNQSVQI